MTLSLRPYQTECLSRIEESFADHQSTLAVLATGLGKTVIFSYLADRRRNKKVLIVAHREELIHQAAKKIESICGDVPGIEMGDMRAEDHQGMYSNSHVIIGTVQTLSREKRRKKFDPTDFGLVIVDEAHHATGDSYRKVIDYFCEYKPCKLLGVTATPNRADQSALGQVFQSSAFNYGIEQAIKDGWLVDIHQEVIKVEGLDFSRVRSDKGDLSIADLEAVLREEKALHAIAGPTVELAGDRPTLVFCVSVNHATLMSEVINRYAKRKACEVIHGETPKEIRRELIGKYQSGELQFLANCGIFLEGFDAPHTSFISMARPTKSLPLYTQVIGRATRPLPGLIENLDSAEERCKAIQASGKPFMTVLDFVGNAGRHKLITATDVLGGIYPESIREEALADIEDAGGATGDALQLAGLHRELMQEQKAAKGKRNVIFKALEEELRLEEYHHRRKAITADLSYSHRNVSPFDGGDYVSPYAAHVTQCALSQKQKWYLIYRVGMSVDAVNRLSKKQAGAIIGSHKGKQQ